MMMNPVQQLSFPVRAARYFKDRGLPLWRKLTALFAVLYVVLPFDAVPDFIPLIGWLDDVGVLGAVAFFFVKEINAHRPLARDATVDGLPRDERSGTPKL